MARQVTSVFHSLPSQRVSVGELSHVSLPVRGKDFLLPSILIWHKIVHSISDTNGVVVFCLCESVEKKKNKTLPSVGFNTWILLGAAGPSVWAAWLFSERGAELHWHLISGASPVVVSSSWRSTDTRHNNSHCLLTLLVWLDGSCLAVRSQGCLNSLLGGSVPIVALI